MLFTKIPQNFEIVFNFIIDTLCDNKIYHGTAK